MKIWAMMMAALLLATAGGALADTPQEIYAQAQEPWRETITAYGREIVIDVTPSMPEVDRLGIYRVTTVSAREVRMDDGAQREAPRKRRGYATRSKPDEVIPSDEIDGDAHAYGNPLSAGEALARTQAFLEPVIEQARQVDVRIDAMTIHSPSFYYNKETGEWGEQIYADEVGSYEFSLACTLGGVEIARLQNRWRDTRNWTYGAPEPKIPYWEGQLLFYDNGSEYKDVRVPSVLEATEQDVELAPMETVRESLRELARQGLLRDVADMRLVYAGFAYAQEPDVWQLRPVWVCNCEIYFDEKSGPQTCGYRKWMENVVIDAQTGEVIQLRWADGE